MAVLNKRDVTHSRGVYIGRGSAWGNPFVIGRDGNRDEVCDKHRAWFRERVRTSEVSMQSLASLHGKDLVCFCAPLRCHGDYIAELAEYAYYKLREVGMEPV